MFRKYLNDRRGNYIIKCDNCIHRIVVDEIKTLARAAGQYKGQEVTLQYFACPKCGQEYPVNYVTPTIRAKQDLMRKYRQQVADAVRVNDGKKAESIRKKHDKLLQWLLNEQRDVKEFFNGGESGDVDRKQA